MAAATTFGEVEKHVNVKKKKKAEQHLIKNSQMQIGGRGAKCVEQVAVAKTSRNRKCVKWNKAEWYISWKDLNISVAKSIIIKGSISTCGGAKSVYEWQQQQLLDK